MGFFNEVGRRAEKLKQQVSDAAAEGAMFECADCGKGIFTKKETCPDCGSEAVVPREEPEKEVEGDDASADGAATETESDLPADIEREEFETDVDDSDIDDVGGDDTAGDTEETAPADVERVEFETAVDETGDTETRDPADGDEDTA